MPTSRGARLVESGQFRWTCDAIYLPLVIAATLALVRARDQRGAGPSARRREGGQAWGGVS
jgi:hypothetical protein